MGLVRDRKDSSSPTPRMEAFCCTCATLLSNVPRFVSGSEKPLPEDRQLPCCRRIICGLCLYVRLESKSRFIVCLPQTNSVRFPSTRRTLVSLSTAPIAKLPRHLPHPLHPAPCQHLLQSPKRRASSPIPPAHPMIHSPMILLHHIHPTHPSP